MAASVVAVGVTATVATGGLAGAAIAGIAAGSGVSTVGVAAIGTFMAGSAVTVMGAADVLEGGTDIFHGFRGSDEESVHLIRDNIQYFRDNPDSYYLLEAMLGTAANAGTMALSPFIISKSQNRNVNLENIDKKGIEIHNPVLDNVRTGSALKGDSMHAFNDIIDNYAGDAQKFSLLGNDGKTRSLYQIEGSLNGKQGIFEWIVDPDPLKGVTHRRFIEGVEITGKIKL